MKARHKLVRWAKQQGANFTCSQPNNFELSGFLLKTPHGQETQRAIKYSNKQADQWFSYCLMLLERKDTIPTSKPDFYQSREWLELRYQALIYHGRRCLCCGATAGDGVKLHVDHIKPRSMYPELELEFNNLQVLCGPCNLGKSNKYLDDFRVIPFKKKA